MPALISMGLMSWMPDSTSNGRQVCRLPSVWYTKYMIYFDFDLRFGFPERVIDEDEEYRTIYPVDGEKLKIPRDESNIIRRSDVPGHSPAACSLLGYTIHDRSRQRHRVNSPAWFSVTRTRRCGSLWVRTGCYG